MVVFAPMQRAEMERQQAARLKVLRATPSAPPAPRNVAAVLDLGNVLYYTFRGRAYGVPPLPWKAGIRLSELWAELKALPDEPDDAALATYQRTLQRLVDLLWRHSRQVGRFRRLLHRLHLLANPYERASEAELAELALRFLARRTKSAIGLRPAQPETGRGTR